MPPLLENPPLLDLSLLREHAQGSLYFFTKAILKYDWLVPHIHMPICQALEDYSKNRKLFVLPRGWLKSTICTVAYPIWRGVHDTSLRILLRQNTSRNAEKKLSSIRGHFEENQLLRALYPEVLPNEDSTWKVDALCLSRSVSFPEATFECAGVQTQVTSRHYDIIIEDDLVAPDSDEMGEEVLTPSPDDISRAIGTHRLHIPLLNNVETGEIIGVGTRWYEHDLIRWIIDNEPQYLKIMRACREDENGNPDPKGKITYPERFNESVLTEIEQSMGPYLFSCLYLNQPVRPSDMIFKPEWIQYYELIPPRQTLAVYTTVDPATDPSLAKTPDTDYSVVMTCGKDTTNGNIYVLDYFREKCSPGELVNAIFNQVRTWRPLKVGYEDVAFQKSLDYWIRERMRSEGLYFTLGPVQYGGKSDRVKAVRISGLQPVFAAKAIFLRTFMKDLVSELLSYPLARHDDLPDCLSMQQQMWKATKVKAQETSEKNNDPLSVDAAIAELRGRHTQNNSPIRRVLETPSATRQYDIMTFCN